MESLARNVQKLASSNQSEINISGPNRLAAQLNTGNQLSSNQLTDRNNDMIRSIDSSLNRRFDDIEGEGIIASSVENTESQQTSGAIKNLDATLRPFRNLANSVVKNPLQEPESESETSTLEKSTSNFR